MRAQIAGFKWKKLDGDWQPLLLLANGQDGDGLARLGLWNGGINIKLGRKICAGYFSGGRHFKCPEAVEVGLASTCSACRQRDDWFGCIQCSGELSKQTDIFGESKSVPSICKNPKQRDGCAKNRYWLYLAAFDRQLKVGVSHERRFFERLIEQGADFGCRLGIVQDGWHARALEQKVARHLELPDKIDGATKQALLFGEPNRSIASIATAITKLKDGRLFDVRPEIFDFRKHYRLSNVLIRPRPVQLMAGVRLVGDVLATKGNIVVMQTAAGTISFDAQRLVGYDVEVASEAVKNLSCCAQTNVEG